MHDAGVSVLADAVAFLARALGEEAVARFWRESFGPRVRARLALGWNAGQHLQRFVEDHRGHGAALEVTEEPDRFVIKLNECGTGARLRKCRPDLAATAKAHPWSWSLAGVPYYCTHCCVAWEILAAEAIGYPLRIHLWPERPTDPCVNLVYKHPEAIPEEYFSRIGMTRSA